METNSEATFPASRLSLFSKKRKRDGGNEIERNERVGNTSKILI